MYARAVILKCKRPRPKRPRPKPKLGFWKSRKVTKKPLSFQQRKSRFCKNTCPHQLFCPKTHFFVLFYQNSPIFSTADGFWPENPEKTPFLTPKIPKFRLFYPRKPRKNAPATRKPSKTRFWPFFRALILQKVRFRFKHFFWGNDTSKTPWILPPKVHFIAGASEKPSILTRFSEVSPELGHTRSACSDEKWRFFLVFFICTDIFFDPIEKNHFSSMNFEEIDVKSA